MVDFSAPSKYVRPEEEFAAGHIPGALSVPLPGLAKRRLERSAVLDLAGPLAGLDVLDVGCGDGVYAVTAARAGARVMALDFYPPFGAAARVLAPLDPLLGHATRFGAAFIATAAHHPPRPS